VLVNLCGYSAAETETCLTHFFARLLDDLLDKARVSFTGLEYRTRLRVTDVEDLDLSLGAPNGKVKLLADVLDREDEAYERQLLTFGRKVGSLY
jgi:hypothetical protein